MDIIRRPAKHETVSPSASAESPKTHTANTSEQHIHYHSTSNIAVIVLLSIILLVLIGAGSVYLYDQHKQNSQPVNTTTTEGSQVNPSEYQGVFLTNGQIYFGKLTTITQNYIKLTDIYYLETQGSQGSSSSSNTSSSSSANSSSSVVLVKLGNEIHGPEDAMQIYRDQVLFWENLKPTGKVAQAIAKYQQ